MKNKEKERQHRWDKIFRVNNMKEIEQHLNKIYNMDCLEFMKTLPDKCIDMTLTSPPYDNLRDYKGYSFDFENIAKELFRITKHGGVVVWVVGDATVNGSETGTSFKQALFFKECGFNLHDTMIYHKRPKPLTHNRYEQHFEYMFVFSKGRPKTFNGIKDVKNKHFGEKISSTTREKDGKTYDSNAKKTGKVISEFGLRGNVWFYEVGKGKGTLDDIWEHPATFGEGLATDHILSWSNEGDIVFDPMCGSGTTCKMAQILKRKWIGSEISAEYCKIAEDRIKSISNTLF